MEYRIDYSSALTERFEKKHSHWDLKKSAAYLVVLCALLAGGILVRTGHAPFMSEDTGNAVQGFLSELSEGVPVGQAVTTFCQNIVKNADLLG